MVSLSKETSNKLKLKAIIINEKWCKGCAICVDVCPKQVLAMDGLVAKVINPEACIVCGRCEISCPDFCLEVFPDDGS
ncbi:4Fe-4S binding protein [bacterium]|nr:4Fe-4S binding protein [candidate division CSSED10-310 bacterium]